MANATSYGLGGAVFGADDDACWRWHAACEPDRSESTATGPTSDAPFGGVKESGLGRELGPEAIESYRESTSIFRVAFGNLIRSDVARSGAPRSRSSKPDPRRINAHTTRAAIIREAPGDLEIVDVEVDDPRQGEIRVRWSPPGCATPTTTCDRRQRGRTPAHGLGHEGTGIVESVGPGTIGWEVGDAVVFTWIPSCGKCRWCTTGMTNLCDRGHTCSPVTASTTRQLPVHLADGTRRRADVPARIIRRAHARVDRLRHQAAAGADLETFWLLGCGVGTGLGQRRVRGRDRAGRCRHRHGRRRHRHQRRAGRAARRRGRGHRRRPRRIQARHGAHDRGDSRVRRDRRGRRLRAIDHERPGRRPCDRHRRGGRGSPRRAGRLGDPQRRVSSSSPVSRPTRVQHPDQSARARRASRSGSRARSTATRTRARTCPSRSRCTRRDS